MNKDTSDEPTDTVKEEPSDNMRNKDTGDEPKNTDEEKIKKVNNDKISKKKIYQDRCCFPETFQDYEKRMKKNTKIDKKYSGSCLYKYQLS